MTGTGTHIRRSRGADWFGEDALPALSSSRVTAAQMLGSDFD